MERVLTVLAEREPSGASTRRRGDAQGLEDWAKWPKNAATSMAYIHNSCFLCSRRAISLAACTSRIKSQDRIGAKILDDLVNEHRYYMYGVTLVLVLVAGLWR
jgi:hypothetical protein